MEGPPKLNEPRRAHAETFGIQPSLYGHKVPEVIRNLADALHRFEREAGGDNDIREEFAGVYPAAQIEHDLAEVRRLELVFDSENDLEIQKSRLYAMVLELIVQDVGHEWFPDIVFWRATRFDDYKRQTDVFMDIPDPDGGWLTLALDVTASRVAATRKRGEVLAEMDSGRFHDVDYFASDIDPGRPKGRAFMPRMVLGTSKEVIESLARLYGQWRQNSPTIPSQTKQQKLDRLRYHELGGQLYEELLSQANYGYKTMRRMFEETPKTHITKRDALKARARYLGKVKRELNRRFIELKRDAARYRKVNGPIPALETPPHNSVLDAILRRAE